jgi:hypothetical protein
MTPPVVRPPRRSRSSWPLRVSLTDSMLAERFEVLGAGSGFFVGFSGSDEGGAVVGEEGFELGAGVAHVGKDGLAGDQPCVFRTAR